MSAPISAVVLDVTLPPDLRPAEAALVRGLAAALPEALRVRATGLRLVSARPPSGDGALPAALARLRVWLAAADPEPVRAAARPRARAMGWRGRGTRGAVRLPAGAIVLVPTLSAWAGPMADAVARRPDLRVVALAAGAAGLAWPEHDTPETAARLVQARAQLDRLGLAAPSAGPVPSVLAGTHPAAPDPALEGAPPFVVAWGALEARNQSALLIQIWRDLLDGGHSPPRLVLVGPRGADAEEIHPLLDWNTALRRHVAEVPALPAQDLRTLLMQARALLSPGLVPSDSAALLRDACAIGVPVLAAPDPAAHPAPGVSRIGALDGASWRAAILAARDGPAAVRAAGAAPTLPDWPRYAAALLAGAAAEPPR